MVDNRPNDDISEDLTSILSDASLWSCLSSDDKSPFTGGESFGFEQAGVRKSTWWLLQSLIKSHKGWFRFPCHLQLSLILHLKLLSNLFYKSRVPPSCGLLGWR
jgi:hypothetical protein